MPEILIRHCSLRLVRRGGWSWGPDPAGLMRVATARLGALLERKLPELFSSDEDFDIAAPVRIRVPVRLQELLAIPDERHPDSATTTAGLDARLDSAIETALAPFMAPPGAAQPAHPEPTEASSESQAAARGQPGRQTRSAAGTALWPLLLSWRERGLLAACMADFSPQALEGWHRCLMETLAEPRPAARRTAPDDLVQRIHSILEELEGELPVKAGEIGHGPPERASQLRLRLRIAVEAIFRFDIEPHQPGFLDALDRVLPVADPTADVVTLTVPKGEAPLASSGTDVPIPTAPKAELRPAKDRRTDEQITSARSAPVIPTSSRLGMAAWDWQGERSVSSVLPFLLLGPLYRIGYLQALAATLEVAGLSGAAPLFAQALAYKVLAPPERGWRRHPMDVATAALFAGQSDPFGAAELADFARRLSPFLAPLDVILRESLIEGHTPGQPLLIHRPAPPDGEGLLLVDVEGIFPIAWAADLDRLLPTLARFGQTPLLIVQATIEAVPLDRLDEQGLRFITDAPPLRHETWRALRRPPSHRFWTNDGATADKTLTAQALTLAVTEEEAGELWRALAVERPGIPLAADRSLDMNLTMTTAAALGAIAWTLWREREPVAPYLTIERFHDLDARVRVDETSVQVRLPLGRRYRDLYEHQLLLDVPDIPWLDGRLLQFSGG